MAAALAVLVAARLPVLIRHRADTVFVAAACACGAALLTNPAVYVLVDHTLRGANLARLLMQALMVTGLWFLRSALLQAVAPDRGRSLVRQLPLYAALTLLVILFLLIGPTSTTTSWGEQYEDILVGAMFSFIGIAFVAWVCGEIAVVCLAHIRTLQGAFRIGFTMVSAGCSIGCLTMTLMSIGVLAGAIPVLAPIHWRDPEGYRVLEFVSIALVGAGLTITAVRGHRNRRRIAQWERDALSHVSRIREIALNEAGWKRTLCDESAPVQERLHRMIVEIWDAELAAGAGKTVLTPDQRTCLLNVERWLAHEDLAEPPAPTTKGMLMAYTHPSRTAARPVTDGFDLYRDMVLYTFKTEFRAGFFIAYYRNFAIPSIARTLAARGETTARPMKRSYDTGIVIHEIIVNGFESDRGQKMVELLRRVHQGVPGSGQDFLYVLMTLLVIPVRWADTHGWRKLTDAEREASLAFYAELGSRMGLDPAPLTFAEAAAFLDGYETQNMRTSPEGAALLEATAEALAVRLPRPLKRKTTSVISLLMDKPEVPPALGLTTAPYWQRKAFNALLHVMATATRMRPVPSKPSFTPGKSGSAVYPKGYALEDIGPR